MVKRVLAYGGAAAALVGGWLWRRTQRRSEQVAGPPAEEMSSSSRSLSAQPRKRTRLVPPSDRTAQNRAVPAPDSAESGRTPYYLVPGEALISLVSDGPLDEETLPPVADPFGAERVPGPLHSYPSPGGDGWMTVVRLRWPDATDYEPTLAHFREVEQRVNERLEWGPARLSTWMPNWLGTVAAAERMYTPGGPAAYPRPLPADAAHLPTLEAEFLQSWRERATRPVTLAVLDAFPDEEALRSAQLPASLARLASQPAGEVTLDPVRHYATFRTGVPFDLSDHGLMAAWLAARVVGDEVPLTLEPRRVATAEGVVSAWDAIGQLAPLARRARDGETIVALLAFVIGMMDIVPPRLRHYEEHYEALRLVCLSLSESGGILVGAAGNDASGLQHPPRTRIPASFRSVIEVTSGQLDQGALSLYANQAKALCLFGGDTNRLYETVEHIPYLVGPAASPRLRSGPERIEENESGWVAWAGTSFAAALAAGLAVLIKSGAPTAPMWEVRQTMRAVATETRNPGNVPFINLVRPATTAE